MREICEMFHNLRESMESRIKCTSCKWMRCKHVGSKGVKEEQKKKKSAKSKRNQLK